MAKKDGMVIRNVNETIMEIFGAAFASIIAMAVAVFIGFVFLCEKKSGFRFGVRFCVKKRKWALILSNGSPGDGAVYMRTREESIMSKERGYRKGLLVKFTVGFMILGIFVITSSCIVGYLQYTDVIERMYNNHAYQIANTAMESIDGDVIEGYVRRIHEADEGMLSQVSRDIQSEADYQNVLAVLNVLRDKMNANHIYIADQTDGNGTVVSTLTYLLDAENPEDNFPAFVPGDTAAMNESFLADSQYIYETGMRSDNYFYSHSDFGYNTSAIAPIKNSDGKVVAILGVELAMKTLQKARINYIAYVAALGAVLTAFMIIVFLMYLKRKVINPIRAITEEADAFVHNETAVSTKLDAISTGDEIQQMAEHFLQMERDIRRYIDDLTKVTAERERIGAELNVATKIQADMLPSIFPPFPNRDEFDIYASMNPAKEVGGDFYDFFMVDDDHLAVVMADVSGKGIPAALFMVVFKTLLKNHAQNGSSAKDVLEAVNHQLCGNNRANMFITAWMGILEISTGRMTCANAGHEYPALCKAGGRYELLKDKHGFALGGLENMGQYAYEVALEPGDKLFLYTDGVPEAANADDELYGTERMVDALNRAAAELPQHTLAAVQKDVDAFVGDVPRFDDLAMLCLHYKGKTNAAEFVEMAEKIRLQETFADTGLNVRANLTVDAEDAVDTVAAKLALDATLENMGKVLAFVEEQMEELGVPVKAQMQVSIAVDEIFSNIARYAYGEGTGTAIVRIASLDEPKGIAVTFVDRGIPYNPLEKADPDITLAAEKREIGGLGIFMVKNSMDEMDYEYRNGQNVLRLVKYW